MYYSVCVPAIYRGMPFPEALERVRRAGYDYYEFWGWWELDLETLSRVQRRLSLTPAAMCARFIPLNDPERRADFVKGLRETVEASERIGCTGLIAQAGPEMPGIPHEAQMDSVADGLRACVPVLEASGRILMLEPLNTQIDHPGYCLPLSEDAFRIADAVGSPHVKVLYDAYHQHITGEDTIGQIRRYTAQIGHIHIAGHPGRHEPLGESEIDFGALYAALRQAGYNGGVGLEYFPLKDPEEGLRKLMVGFPLRA